MPLKIGDKAPDFTLPTDGGGTLSLKSLRGKKVVLYFYPKDMTPGCTKEACDFRDAYAGLRRKKVEVIGVSKDGPARHDAFKEKYALPFLLASDEKGETIAAYGVWKKKSLYGRSFMGIERSTFLIDAKGALRGIWRKVKVAGHVTEIQAAIDAL
ncbi:MAG: thioredoxin-dependent thiol peroxidase [Pseudomonadota bacterium]